MLSMLDYKTPDREAYHIKKIHQQQELIRTCDPTSGLCVISQPLQPAVLRDRILHCPHVTWEINKIYFKASYHKLITKK